MFGLASWKKGGARLDDASALRNAGLMQADDRVTYIDKVCYVVLVQCADGTIELCGAYMDQEKAAGEARRLKQDGAYSWYRQVRIEG